MKPQFLVRYRIINRPDDFTSLDWKYSQVGRELEAPLDLDEVRNGDELQAQVKSLLKLEIADDIRIQMFYHQHYGGVIRQTERIYSLNK